MKDTVYYNQLISKFFDTAKNNQEKIAVREIDREITFSKLYCEVLFLSKKNFEIYIIKGINVRIGVFLSKSIESSVADLAILLSGNVFVNHDIKNGMLCALKTAVVGTDSSTRKSLLDKNDSFEYCALCYGKKICT